MIALSCLEGRWGSRKMPHDLIAETRDFHGIPGLFRNNFGCGKSAQPLAFKHLLAALTKHHLHVPSGNLT